MTTSANHQLIYTASGNPANPLLILIHGWGSHRGVWRTTIPTFQDRFYCIAVDLLGFADNEKPDDGDYSIAAQAQRVVTLADELGFKTFNLMGHSMGGQIATYIAALAAPERVERLVSVGGVVTGQLSPYMKYIMFPNALWGRAMPVVYDLSRRWVEQYRWYANFVFWTWFYDLYFTAFDDWKIDRQLALQRSASKSLVSAFRSIRKTDLTAHLDCIQAKTLILFGEYDGAVPVHQAHLLKKRIANAQLVLYDKCGHFPMFEKTDAYLVTLNSFLAS